MPRILKLTCLLLFAVLLLGCNRPLPQPRASLVNSYMSRAELNSTDKDAIRRVHSILNNNLHNGLTPDENAATSLKRMNTSIRRIASKSEHGALRRDLIRYAILIDNARPGVRSDWVVAHRIVHDIDHFLLGRGTKDDPIFWGESEAVKDIRGWGERESLRSLNRNGM